MDMEAKKNKHAQLEAAKIDELHARELRFEAKRQKIEEIRIKREIEEQQSLENSLKKIEQKMQTSHEVHRKHLKRIMSETRSKNNQLTEKVARWREEKEKRDNDEREILIHQEEQVKKKMLKMVKESKEYLDAWRGARLAKTQRAQQNKQ